ncbi:LysE/ArgO family amino acid transporter [Alicyclobacillus dauci]|uniref:LysE family transporter n=1 Tax=Alicyclobacillus dauci TaxID=1475485 RepID=A0ABY6Z4W0_9BACL|nr:LysE family transporter [Alicyclobacillus dauci]WAH37917.1 LysE family transporter [Alicyclobacillus dauci]
MLIAFVHGIILSFGLIMPIGMQNGFILTQGAVQKRWVGAMPAIATAALCDTLLIGLSVVGLSSAAFAFVWLRVAMGVIGIVFLLYMGWRTWRDDSTEDSANQSPWSTKRQVRFAASVSLLNPHAWLDTLAVIGGSVLVYSSWNERISFGVACTVVSWVWFIALAVMGHVAGRVMFQSSARIISRVSALMMFASAIYLSYIMFTFQR